jgi:hypothetical protein
VPVSRATNANPLTEVFSVPTAQYIKYESTVWLPWFIKRYILRNNIPRPPAIIERAKFVDKDVEKRSEASE